MKRAFDVVASAILLLLLTPLFLIIAILVYWQLGKPIIFKQARPGLNGKIFSMYKFRTMTDSTDRQGQLLPDGQRMTAFGVLLRSTSLDELPELWNVLKGDMSFVGPRPLLVEYLPLYDSRQMLRHNVRPGLTGWAQINGRNSISWEEKFELDVWYVQNRSFFIDVRILAATFFRLISRDGITEQGAPTANRFGGRPTDESSQS